MSLSPLIRASFDAEKMEQNNQCWACGEPIAADASQEIRFCPKCGSSQQCDSDTPSIPDNPFDLPDSLSIPNSPLAQPTPPAQPRPEELTKKSNDQLVFILSIACAVLVTALIAVVATVLFLGQSRVVENVDVTKQDINQPTKAPPNAANSNRLPTSPKVDSPKSPNRSSPLYRPPTSLLDPSTSEKQTAGAKSSIPTTSSEAVKPKAPLRRPAPYDPPMTSPPPRRTPQLANDVDKTKAEAEPEKLSREQLNATLLERTVSLRVETTKGVLWGSGFVFSRSDDQAIIITSSDTVTTRHGAIRTISCLLNSQPGDAPRTVAGTLMARVPNRGIAIVSIEGDDLPRPFERTKEFRTKKDATVIAAGIGRSDLEKIESTAPPLEIMYANVNKIEKTASGRTSLLQTNENIKPKHSGAPVIDQSGRLVGAVVASSDRSGVGIVMPFTVLDDTVQGTPTSLSIGTTRSGNYARVAIHDPLRNITKGSLIFYRPEDELKEIQTADGRWKVATREIVRTRDLKLVGVQKDSLYGGLDAPTRATPDVPLRCQLAIHHNNNRTKFFKPFDYSDDTSGLSLNVDPSMGSLWATNRSRDAVATQELSRTEVLSRVRRATTYVKARTSKGMQTGSGFLFLRKDESSRYQSGIVATNAHVVTAENRLAREVTCVFNSGIAGEFSVSGHVLGTDVERDLAFIRVSDRNLPKPMDWDIDSVINETSPVLVAGFPFGSELSLRKGNPAITITRGSVTSIRAAELGAFKLVQIEAGINPGNSGGPVVDEQGRLIGIAVAKLEDTNIGFAIHRDILRDTIQGRAAVANYQEKNGLIWFDVKLQDPIWQVTGGELIVFSSNEKLQSWEKSPHITWSQESTDLLAWCDLRRSDDSLRGQLKPFEKTENLKCQIRLDYHDGRNSTWTRPFQFTPPGEVGIINEAKLVEVEPHEVADTSGEAQQGAYGLPERMEHFAINPATGDIACLSRENNKVYLALATQLGGESIGEWKEAELSEKPTGICFKEFSGKRYVAVSCPKSHDVHLFDARTLDPFTTITCNTEALNDVSASRHPDDPFIYYTAVWKGRAFVGVIDLREMLDRGPLIDLADRCTVTPDGRRLLLRVGGNMETRRIESDFSREKPSVSPREYQSKEDRDSQGFVCLPRGNFVVNKDRVLDSTLRRQIEKLDYEILDCFQSHPLLVGISKGTPSEPYSVRLMSTNWFNAIGVDVRLPDAVSASILRVRAEGYAYRKEGRLMVFADDANDRVVVACGATLTVIPMEMFSYVKEPMMELNQYQTEWIVGEHKTVAIHPIDSSIKLTFPDLPQGMKHNENGIAWSPTPADVGDFKIDAILSQQNVQKKVEISVKVSHPYLDAGINTVGFLVADDESFLVCWSGRQDYSYVDKDRKSSTLAIIPYRSKRKSIRKQLSYYVDDVQLFKHRIVAIRNVTERVTTSRNRSSPRVIGNQFELFSADSLNPIRSISTTDPIQSIDEVDGKLVLSFETMIQTYELDSFQLIDTVRKSEPAEATLPDTADGGVLMRDGIFKDGILYTNDGTQRRLLVAPPGTIPMLSSGVYLGLLNGGFLRQLSPDEIREPSHRRIPIPNSDRFLSVRTQDHSETIELGNSRARRQSAELEILDGAENLLARLPIAAEYTTLNKNIPLWPTLVHVGKNECLLNYRRRIYRLNTEELLTDFQNATDSELLPPPELHFKPNQSHFVIMDDSTVLPHSVSEGKTPFTYYLIESPRGFSIDHQRGDVTLDRETLVEQAIRTVEKRLGGSMGDELKQKLQKLSRSVASDYQRFTGEELKGVPVAIPIHVRVGDADMKTAQLQYFVFLDIPIDRIMEEN